jgi:parallel beta-helix repeat protein
VTIRNNFIDVRKSDVPTSGNGILAQATTGTTLVGPILIEQNTVFGGSNQGVITNILSNGIYVFGPTMRDVTIRNNTITRTGQSGIRIEGSNFVVENNKMTDVGGGGIPGFVVIASNSRIVNNSFTYSGQGPSDGRMVISSSSRNNVYQNNPGFQMTRGEP